MRRTRFQQFALHRPVSIRTTPSEAEISQPYSFQSVITNCILLIATTKISPVCFTSLRKHQNNVFRGGDKSAVILSKAQLLITHYTLHINNIPFSDEKKKRKTMVITVIGGGASGCVAAIGAARAAKDACVRARVVILEKLPVLLKKIPATGNGRCNLLNREPAPDRYHGDAGIYERVFSRSGYDSLAGFYNSLGLRLAGEEGGRIYPASFRAESVVCALEREIRRLGIIAVTGCRVTGVRKTGGGFEIDTDAGVRRSDAVIIAGGGRSSPAHGPDGSAFALAKSIGARITPFFPALTPLVLKEKNPSLKGTRLRGKIEIVSGGDIVGSSTGELQFTDYGVSGIPALDVSGTAAKALASGEVMARITTGCFADEKDAADALGGLFGSYPDEPVVELLSSFVPRKLAIAKLKNCGIGTDSKAGGISGGVFDTLCSLIYSETFTVTGVRGYNDSQITAGGIAGESLTEDLMLRSAPGAFACGEVLDVDGVCGGYNLTFAAASGLLAGEAAFLFSQRG